MTVAPDQVPSTGTPASALPSWRRRWASVAVYTGLVLATVAYVWVASTAEDFLSSPRLDPVASAVWVVTGLLLGLALLACCPHGVRWGAAPIGALLAWLASQWRALAIAYGILVLLWSLAAAALHVANWPLLFDALFSHTLDPASDDSNVGTNAILVVVFVALQLAFISGAGRISVRREAPPPWKMTLSIAIFAVTIGCITWATLAACLELVDRLDASSGRAGIHMLGDREAIGPAIVGGFWLFWLGVGWVLARGVPRETALGRMAAIVIAGSWIEFAVALPVELVTRDRTKDCPCASGSWIALMSSGPLLLWAIGPAILLLYRYEWGLTLDDPSHARRVLQRKTRRRRTAA
jgi:hypothetical protein